MAQLGDLDQAPVCPFTLATSARKGARRREKELWTRLREALRALKKPPRAPEVDVEGLANAVLLRAALGDKRASPEKLRAIIREAIERNLVYIRRYYALERRCSAIGGALNIAEELEELLKKPVKELERAYGPGYLKLKVTKVKGRTYVYPLYRVTGSKRDIYLSKSYIFKIKRLREVKEVIRKLKARAAKVCRDAEHMRDYLKGVGLLP